MARDPPGTRSPPFASIGLSSRRPSVPNLSTSSHVVYKFSATSWVVSQQVECNEPPLSTGWVQLDNGGSRLFRHGQTALPAHREHLPYCVTSTEQDKPVSLPARGRSTVRRIDGGAGIGIARKRMLPCNRADRGCVALMGQDYLTGNGADFAMVFKLETICGTDKGSNANDGGASCWCSLPHARWIFHRRASWPQISIE